MDGLGYHSRPQSHRFLQETLNKLTQDSIRAGSPSVANTDAESSRQTTPAWVGRPEGDVLSQRGAGLTGLVPPESDLSGRPTRPRSRAGQRLSSPEELQELRLVVREEVASALNSGVVTHVLEGWSAQFSTWRKSDDHVVRQIRGQLGELEEANRALINFLNEYITTSEFAQFREAMNKYSTLVDELSESRQGHESVLLSTVEHVVNKAVSAATSNLGQLIEEKTAQQVTRHAMEQRRQISEVLESVETYASQVSQQFENQHVVLQDKLGSVMQDIGSVMQSRMQSSADEIAASTLQAAHEGARNMKMVTTSEIEKLRRYMQRLIAGTDEDTEEEAEEGLRPMMQNFGEILVQGVSTNQQAEDWRQMAVHAQEEMQAAREALESKCFETEELRKKWLDMDGSFQVQQDTLKSAQELLAKPWPWTRYSAFLDEIVARGRVKVNVYEEVLEVLSGMNFEPRKPTLPPTAALMDPDAAETALSDAFEVLECFGDLPLVVESHVKTQKGKAEFWDAIALNRAELIRDLLESKGVPFRQMTAVGCYGKAGLDRNSIILRPKLFPKKEVSPKASPRAKAK